MAEFEFETEHLGQRAIVAGVVWRAIASVKISTVLVVKSAFVGIH